MAKYYFADDRIDDVAGQIEKLLGDWPVYLDMRVDGDFKPAQWIIDAHESDTFSPPENVITILRENSTRPRDYWEEQRERNRK